MGAIDLVGAVQLGTRLRGVSPPVVRTLQVPERAPLAALHRILQVAYGWNDEYAYTFLIRGWRFGDPRRAAQLARGGDRVDLPLAAFGLEIGEAFRYRDNTSHGWKIDCRLEARCPVAATEMATCLAARGDPPNEDLGGPAAYPQWYEDSEPDWALYQVEELLDEDLDPEQFRVEARKILAAARLGAPRRREINEKLRCLLTIDGDSRSLYENAGPGNHRR